MVAEVNGRVRSTVTDFGPDLLASGRLDAKATMASHGKRLRVRAAIRPSARLRRALLACLLGAGASLPPLLATAAERAVAAAAGFEPLGQIGREGDSYGRFRLPTGIAIDREGYLYVADAAQARIQKFTSDGRFVREIGARDRNQELDLDELEAPYALAITPSQRLLVVEPGRGRVSMWSLRGRYLGSFGSLGSAPGQLSYPKGIAVAPDGTIFVADAGNRRVDVFDSAGRWMRAIGQGEGYLVPPDQLSYPSGIALAPDGTLFVGDENYQRVQAYASGDGSFRGGFEDGGVIDVVNPAGLAVGPNGLVVVDQAQSALLLFSSASPFAYRGRIDLGPGGQRGQVAAPTFAAFDCTGALYVTDRDNRRVQRFGPAGARTCGNHSGSRSEPLMLTVLASKKVRYGRYYAIPLRVGCDRPCLIQARAQVGIGSGSVRLASRQRAAGGSQALVSLLLSTSRDDKLLRALRSRARRATIVVSARDLAGRPARRRLSLTLAR